MNNWATDWQRAAPWVWLGLLACVVALFGGSSRPDALQNVALRPISALFLIPALLHFNLASLNQVKALCWLIGLLTLWMVLQIVPLPPILWQSLPARDAIADLDLLFGLEDNWRPISNVPSRGWNALTSLVIPITALILAISMRASPRSLLLILVGMGVFDAVLGLLQLISGANGFFHLYAITHRDAPVGIFANENHSAVFSAIVMIVIARLWVTSKNFGEPAWLRFSYPIALVMIFLAALVTGSRAGLTMLLLALIVSGILAAIGQKPTHRTKRHGQIEDWLSNHPRLLLAIFGCVVLGLMSVFFGLERAPGAEAIFTQNPFEDLRARLWPVLSQMISNYWLLGIGFGAFEEVYHIHEKTDLLLPNYVNHAHNDWAQLLIEGGVPAFALLLILLIWIALSLRKLLRCKEFAFGRLVFWSAIFAILCAASIVDYPLRTPIFQLAGIWLLLSLALERQDPSAV